MLFGVSTKHSGPEWKPLSAVVIGTQRLRFSDVPLNSSSSVHCHVPPVAFGIGAHEGSDPLGMIVVVVVLGVVVDVVVVVVVGAVVLVVVVVVVDVEVVVVDGA